MRKILISGCLLCWALAVQGQINSDLSDSDWKIGTVRQVYNHRVLRLIGGNDSLSMTNIGYQNLDDIVQEVEFKSQIDYWTTESTMETIHIYTNFYMGGLLHFFVAREEGEDANAHNFEVVLKDSMNQGVLFKHRLEEDPANAPSAINNHFWNYFTLPLPLNLPETFYVILIDYASPFHRKYTFVVQTSL